MTDKARVLVTGASGYIAMHCILQLLEQGYHVRGTVRSLDREPRLRQCFAEHIDADDRLEFAVADLLKPDGWADAMRDCQFVLHVASPVMLVAPEDDNLIIKPAIDGTKHVLQAAAEMGIQRVVQTSSVAAVQDPTVNDNERIWDESDMPEANPRFDAYRRSKILAEQFAWDFVQKHPELELAVINPGLVIGPLFDDQFSASLEALRKLMRNDVPGLPRLGWSFVDVRDVARAHILAMITAEAAGKRFCCVSEFAWYRDIAKMVNNNFADEGIRVPTRQLPNILIKLFSLFDKEIQSIVPELGKPQRYSTEQIRTVLDWTPRPLEETVIDTGKSLIKHGMLEKK